MEKIVIGESDFHFSEIVPLFERRAGSFSVVRVSNRLYYELLKCLSISNWGRPGFRRQPQSVCVAGIYLLTDTRAADDSLYFCREGEELVNDESGGRELECATALPNGGAKTLSEFIEFLDDADVSSERLMASPSDDIRHTIHEQVLRPIEGEGGTDMAISDGGTGRAMNFPFRSWSSFDFDIAASQESEEEWE